MWDAKFNLPLLIDKIPWYGYVIGVVIFLVLIMTVVGLVKNYYDQIKEAQSFQENKK